MLMAGTSFSLVHTAPEEFEHGVFILKMHKVHTTPREKCKNRSVCVEENSSRVSYLFDKHRGVY